jgi:hypothetical protein
MSYTQNNRQYLYLIIPLLLLIIISAADGHLSTLVATTVAYTVLLRSTMGIRNKFARNGGIKLFGIVFSLYLISSYIASFSFLQGNYFFVKDPVKYINMFASTNSWSFDDFLFDLYHNYFEFGDNNPLYNHTLLFWSYMANKFLDGTSVFYMTLLQTFFGVLTSIEIYKIFVNHFDVRKAVRYSCAFALLSLFHIYSTVIIRDVIIAYFYVLGFRIVMREPKISDIFLLIFIFVVITGIRFYTGLFFVVIIMFWLQKMFFLSKYVKYKVLLIPIIIVALVMVGASFFSSFLLEQTFEEIHVYEEMSEEGGNMSNALRELPLGIKHISLMLLSQLGLNAFGLFKNAETFSHIYLAFLNSIYLIFSFVIFYGLMFFIFFDGYLKKIKKDFVWLLVISLLFIMLNVSAHMDVRRCMGVIPYIYFLYIYYQKSNSINKWHNVNKVLTLIAILFNFIYFIVR